MPKTFSLAKYAETLERTPPAETVRDIEAVTCEVLHLKQELARNIVDIGLRLMEAKAMLPHGEWLPWLEEKVHFSEKSAQNYMRVAREFPNPQLVADLGVRKALALLELPPAERESFTEENNVIDMTSRELEKAIRERDEARKEAEAAKADAQAAEESWAKIETDMKALKYIHNAATEELMELRKRPVDVAVEVDQEAVERARAEAVAGMEERVRLAETARREAETALEEARRQLEGTGRQDERKTSRRKKDSAAIAQARSAAETALNQIHGVRLLSIDRDTEMSEEARRTLLNLADYARRCAE